MPRRNRFLGRWLAHGEGYPDLSLRFFHRAHASWSNDEVHEAVLTTTEVGRMAGDLLHESADDIATYIAKQNRYTTLHAEALYRAGRARGLLAARREPDRAFREVLFPAAGACSMEVPASRTS